VKDLFDNTLHEIEGVQTPINDTLNIKNGMNYAMFLEAILRICYYRAENEGVPYKRVLDQIFNDASNNIDIQKRTLEDPVLAIVYSPEVCAEFEQYTDVLQAVFDKFASNPDGFYMELKHDAFIHIMIESGIVVVPKKKEETKKEETKKKTAA